MSFFRRANEPSAAETFLRSALAVVGFGEAEISAAMEADRTDFLKVLDQGSALTAAIADAKAANDAKDAAVSARDAVLYAVTGAGLSADEVADADKFKAAIAKRVSDEAAKLAIEISAARGIQPVASAPTESGEAKLKGFAAVQAAIKETVFTK